MGRLALSLLLLVASCFGATTFLEPGGDATFTVVATNGFWTAIGGTPAVATDFVHGTHVKSIQYRTSNSDSVTTATGTLADAGARISVYLYFNALPITTKKGIFGLRTSSNSEVVWLNMTTAGVLQLWNNATTAQIGTDGATLSTAQWYRISLAYTISSTSVNRFELFVNGASSISVTNATLARTGTSRFFLGNLDSSTTMDMRSSDHYIDNSNALTDPGDIWVTAKRPNANGTANQFTTQVGSGGSGYGSGHAPQDNERPLSATNAWSLSNTTVQTEEYTIESASTGDINLTGATIVDFMGWISAKVNSTSNSPVHHIIVAGTSTAKTMTTSDAMYTQIAGSTTYPAGNTDIGMDAAYTTTPHLTTLEECGIIMAFIPAPPPVVSTRRLALLGVGP